MIVCTLKNIKYIIFWRKMGKMKKRTLIMIGCIILVLAAMVYGYIGNRTLLLPDTVEENGFQIQMPGNFVQQEDFEFTSYLNDSTSMFIDIHYYDNEFGLTLKEQAQITNIYELGVDDILKSELVEINGVNAWQTQYRTLQKGNDDVHYYYNGLFTVFLVEDEYLLIDSYKCMTEADGIKNSITDSDLNLLKDIIDTVVIGKLSTNISTNETQNVQIEQLLDEINANWVNVTDEQYRTDEYGSYESYEYLHLPICLDYTVYTEENITDIDSLKENMQELVDSDIYAYLGIVDVLGEEGLLYSYNNYETSSGYYSSGAFAVSEHYYIDAYISYYEDSYDISDVTMDKIISCIKD